MDPDKQLVRTQEDGQTNLAIGEPYFLHKHLHQFMEGGDKGPFKFPTYPNYKGDPVLLHELEYRHPGLHVVVTNGAKQALLAAFYALKEACIDRTVCHRTPLWPSYRTLVRLSGLSFLDDSSADIQVSTSPNNPDGSIEKKPVDVLDAAYAHEVYGWDGTFPSHEVSVWSAAKLLGLSGLRVGWLVTGDRTLADLAADYVEKTTSGVNVEAQRRIAWVLGGMSLAPAITTQAYTAARVDLMKNGSFFNHWIAPYCEVVDGLPHNGRGMFAWFKVKSPTQFRLALQKSKVLVVNGAACGMEEDGWFRMSMGHCPEFTRSALENLADKLVKVAL